MNTHLTTSRTGRFPPRTQRYLVAACGAALALVAVTGLAVGLGQADALRPASSEVAADRATASTLLSVDTQARPIPAAVYEQIGAAAAPEQQRPIPLTVYQRLGSPAVEELRQQPIPAEIYEQLSAVSAAQSQQQPIPQDVYESQ